MTNQQARLISLSVLACGGAILLASSGVAALIGMVILFGAIWMYIFEYRESDKVRTPKEPRCRMCNHILRNLSEPRCPECGEKI